MSVKIKQIIEKSKSKLKIGTGNSLHEPDMTFDEVPSTPVTKYKNKRKLMQQTLLDSSTQRSGSSNSIKSNSRFAKKLSGSFTKTNSKTSNESIPRNDIVVGWMDDIVFKKQETQKEL
jgi:hypothetical protein